MDIKLERVPSKDSHVHAWIDFDARLSELGKQGYNLTHVTETYVILQK